MATDVALWAPPTDVVVATHAFRTETIHLAVPAGRTLAEIIAAAGLPLDATLRVWVDDWLIPAAHWATTRPRPGRQVFLRVVAGGGGGGGNKTLRLVLTIVVAIVAIVAAVFTAGTLAPALGFAAGGTGAMLLGGLAGSVVSIGGALAINALLPPPKPRMRDTTTTGQSPTYAITGTQNVLAPYQPVPRVYGRHRLFPPLAGHPVTHGEGLGNTLSQLFTLGYGPLAIEDIRIGDTPIGGFEGVTLEVRGGWPGDPPLATYPFAQHEESLGIDLTPPVNSTINSAMRATEETDQLGVEILFPRGLIRIDDKNVTWPFGGLLIIEAQPADGASGSIRLVEEWKEDARAIPLRVSYAWNMRERGYGRIRWHVTVTWQIPAGWEGEVKPNPIVVYDCAWTALRTAQYEDPIRVAEMAKIGLTLTASGQLTGVVQQLNCIATSYLWVTWDGGATWSQQQTRNPAFIFLDILRGAANARRAADAEIDLAAISAWAGDCHNRGYTFDAVFDVQSTVFEALQLVAAAGRASFTLRNGKYSIVRDLAQTVPVQHFTPRNSSGFRATKTFLDLPHALKVAFINPAANWQKDERFVYDDGYDASTATKFDGLELFGITSADLAWRHGRYWLAAAKLRPEVYSLGVDLEYLVAERGDLVHVQHEVTMWGYASARVVRVLRDGGGLVEAVVLDECLDDVPWAATATARIRRPDGSSVVVNGNLDPHLAERTTYFWPAGHPLALAVEDGDLVSLGELGQATIPLIVSRIEPGPDLTARLTLVDAAPGILVADQGPIPPFESYITHRPSGQRLEPLPPVIDSVASDELAMLNVGGAWLVAIRVSCHALFDATRLLPTDLEVSFRPHGSSGQWVHLPTQPATATVALFYCQPVVQGQTYDLRARTVSTPNSVASPWVIVTHTVIGESTLPPPPINLQLDLDQTHLRWQYPTPPRDFPGGFRVRVIAGVSGTWEQGAPLHDGLVSDTTFALPPLGGGRYTFLVKAVDRTGNESRDAAVLVSDIDAAPTNIIERDEYDPTFPGLREGLELQTDPPPPHLCNILITDGPFWTVDSAAFWTADALDFWGGVYGAGTYQIGVDFLPEEIGTTLTLDWVGSGPWLVEYRTSGDSLFWQTDGQLFYAG